MESKWRGGIVPAVGWGGGLRARHGMALVALALTSSACALLNAAFGPETETCLTDLDCEGFCATSGCVSPESDQRICSEATDCGSPDGVCVNDYCWLRTHVFCAEDSDCTSPELCSGLYEECFSAITR